MDKQEILNKKDINPSSKISKTYTFFEQDVADMLRMGSSAAEIFRLGVLAKKNNPIVNERIDTMEINIKKYAERLSRMFKKLDIYKRLLEKFMGQKIDDMEL